MKRLPKFLMALYAGNQVDNVTGVKKVGLAASIATMITSVLVGVAVSSGWVTAVPEEVVVGLNSVLITALGAALTWIQVATTKKLGLKAPDESEVPE